MYIVVFPSSRNFRTRNQVDIYYRFFVDIVWLLMTGISESNSVNVRSEYSSEINARSYDGIVIANYHFFYCRD